MILNTPLQWLKQINTNIKPQETPYTSLERASYGGSFVTNLKIDRAIMAPHNTNEYTEHNYVVNNSFSKRLLWIFSVLSRSFLHRLVLRLIKSRAVISWKSPPVRLRNFRLGTPYDFRNICPESTKVITKLILTYCQMMSRGYVEM